MLEQLTSSMGDSLYTDQSTPGGYRFLNHAANATTYTKIHDQQWDFVVLQAQSQEPSWPVSQIETEVFPYAKKICDSVKVNNQCSEVLFFETWGRENGDAGNCVEWPPVCTFEGMNDRLLVGYYTMAVENNAAMAPVGLAWKSVREDGLFTNINLYAADGSHPSVYGTYLIACVMYNSMFKKNVNTDFFSSISESEAKYLQAKANEVFSLDFEYYLDDDITVQEYSFNKSSWFENGVSVVSDFDFEENNLEVSFTNRSINGQNYSWSFGDAEVSNEIDPIHIYDSMDLFDAKLITFGACGVDTTNKVIDLITGLKLLDENESLSINKKGKTLIFENLEEVSRVEIYTVDGKSIAVLQVSDTKQSQYVVSDNISLVVVKFVKHNETSFSKKIVL
jgi:hypothetical protein